MFFPIKLTRLIDTRKNTIYRTTFLLLTREYICVPNKIIDNEYFACKGRRLIQRPRHKTAFFKITKIGHYLDAKQHHSISKYSCKSMLFYIKVINQSKNHMSVDGTRLNTGTVRQTNHSYKLFVFKQWE